MSAKTCPRCGRNATGNFCATCGASLEAKACPTCGATPEPGSRFCTRCGAPLAAGLAPPGATATGPHSQPGRGDGQMGWWAAGGLLVVLLLLVAWPILTPDAEPQQPQMPVGGGGVAGGTGAAAGPSSVDLSTMTPRAAADRLYRRVMEAAEAGDSASVAAFLPMAIAAHDRAQPLDVDGLFHLSSLQRVGGDFTSALATAREALAEAPDHLLANYAAAEAAVEMGDTAAAREHYQRLLDAWDAEMASGNLDYESHATMMDNVRQTARDFVGGDR